MTRSIIAIVVGGTVAFISIRQTVKLMKPYGYMFTRK